MKVTRTDRRVTAAETHRSTLKEKSKKNKPAADMQIRRMVTQHKIQRKGEDVTSLYCGIKPFCSMEVFSFHLVQRNYNISQYALFMNTRMDSFHLYYCND
ncbi:hypothetical protein ATANTOWER_023366 [Ataeniobius toweri]|uniref:Uncharacterized protein n=1 Tax=Ataeniobius toweri TaxID=208326 RepID=A0ABU7BXS0_9TELE|nr:hypothetical protein [Ataeniobius toweri]